jgi:hypothetical protein
MQYFASSSSLVTCERYTGCIKSDLERHPKVKYFLEFTQLHEQANPSPHLDHKNGYLQFHVRHRAQVKTAKENGHYMENKIAINITPTNMKGKWAKLAYSGVCIRILPKIFKQ